MAAVSADYPFQNTYSQVTIAQLIIMTNQEVAAVTAANAAYAAGWPETANYSEYTVSGGGTGLQNYQAKTFGNNTATA